MKLLNGVAVALVAAGAGAAPPAARAAEDSDWRVRAARGRCLARRAPARAPPGPAPPPPAARTAEDSDWMAAARVEAQPGTDPAFNGPALDGCPFITPDGEAVHRGAERRGGR